MAGPSGCSYPPSNPTRFSAPDSKPEPNAHAQQTSPDAPTNRHQKSAQSTDQQTRHPAPPPPHRYQQPAWLPRQPPPKQHETRAYEDPPNARRRNPDHPALTPTTNRTSSEGRAAKFPFMTTVTPKCNHRKYRQQTTSEYGIDHTTLADTVLRRPNFLPYQPDSRPGDTEKLILRQPPHSATHRLLIAAAATLAT